MKKMLTDNLPIADRSVWTYLKQGTLYACMLVRVRVSARMLDAT